MGKVQRRGKRQNSKFKFGRTETEIERGVYNAKNSEVKRSARKDKRNWLEKRAAAAEKATESGRNKELYSITRSITGERRKQETGCQEQTGGA